MFWVLLINAYTCIRFKLGKGKKWELTVTAWEWKGMGM